MNQRIIIQEENPRLNRSAFLIFWIASYIFSWFLIYCYEQHHDDIYELNNIESWLRQYRFYGGIGENLFVGLLFGLGLVFIQTWLIKQRFGFVPKFWHLATLMGATLTGFGYIRVWGNDPSDALVWFGTISLFQTVVMLRINRRAWLLIIIGIVAGISAAQLLEMRTTRLYYYTRFAIIMGTAIQAFGTAFIMHYLMEHTRKAVVPKRNTREKAKKYSHKNVQPITFLSLWLMIHAIGYSVISILFSLIYSGGRTSERLNQILYWFSRNDLHWLIDVFIIVIAVTIAANMQRWLIQY